MSELQRDNSESKMDELRDGPQPGFRRYSEKELAEMALADEAQLELLAENFGGDEERDIGRHIALFED